MTDFFFTQNSANSPRNKVSVKVQVWIQHVQERKKNLETQILVRKSAHFEIMSARISEWNQYKNHLKNHKKQFYIKFQHETLTRSSPTNSSGGSIHPLIDIIILQCRPSDWRPIDQWRQPSIRRGLDSFTQHGMRRLVDRSGTHFDRGSLLQQKWTFVEILWRF